MSYFQVSKDLVFFFKNLFTFKSYQIIVQFCHNIVKHTLREGEHNMLSSKNTKIISRTHALQRKAYKHKKIILFSSHNYPLWAHYNLFSFSIPNNDHREFWYLWIYKPEVSYVLARAWFNRSASKHTQSLKFCLMPG